MSREEKQQEHRSQPCYNAAGHCTSCNQICSGVQEPSKSTQAEHIPHGLPTDKHHFCSDSHNDPVPSPVRRLYSKQPPPRILSCPFTQQAQGTWVFSSQSEKAKASSLHCVSVIQGYHYKLGKRIQAKLQLQEFEHSLGIMLEWWVTAHASPLGLNFFSTLGTQKDSSQYACRQEEQNKFKLTWVFFLALRGSQQANANRYLWSYAVFGKKGRGKLWPVQPFWKRSSPSCHKPLHAARGWATKYFKKHSISTF